MSLFSEALERGVFLNDTGPKEIRVVDPDTGGMKGKKLATFSSIPPDVLLELAEHYGKGSRKYPDPECTCAEIAAKLQSTTQGDSASGATCEPGERSTQATGADISAESPKLNMTPSLLNPAVYAGPPSGPAMSTMITTAAHQRQRVDGAFGDPFATRATSVSASTNATDPSGRNGHLPGCNYGRQNWQLGYDWRLSVDALQRHLNAFLRGEDFDEETGSSHLIAVMWHAAALRWFQLHGKGKDFR